MSRSNWAKVCLEDHFTGAALRGEYAGLAENSGTAAIAVGIEGGVVTLVTGTTSGNRAQLHAGLNWKPSAGSVRFRGRVKSLTAITNRAIFVGLTDTVAQENPIEIGASDAVTSNATDAVGFIYDTDAATDKWFCAGVKADVDTALTAVNLDGAQALPVIDEWQEFGIDVNSDGDAVFYFGRDATGKGGLKEVARIANCVTPGTLLTPIVLVEARTTAAQTVYVDYLRMEGSAA